MPRRLSDWLKAYIEYTAFNEAPVSFHFWAGVWAVAAVLRRKVFIDQEYYILTPNFYVILVAPPAIATKSTALGIASRVVREVSGIHFGPNTLTREALPKKLELVAEAVEMEPGTFFPMSCLSFSSSELGVLLDVDDRKMLDWLTDFWDANTSIWEKETKTMGSESIPNPWLNIIAATTPGWIADNIPRILVSGGLFSRCVWVFERKKRQLVAFPKDIVPKGIKLMKEDLIHDLELISCIKGEYDLTPAAKVWLTAWYKMHHESTPANLRGEEFGGYVGRKQGHVLKLAMVLSASHKDERVLELADAQAAVKIMTALEADMPEVFKAIHTTETQAKTMRMLEIIQHEGSIPRGVLYRGLMTSMTPKEFVEGLDSGVQAGVIQVVQRGNTIFIEVAPPEDEGRNDHKTDSPVGHLGENPSCGLGSLGTPK